MSFVPWLSIGVAGIALIVSLFTLWLTHLRLGTIKMTRPSQIYFGPDGGRSKSGKVFMHTLLYATSVRGMHLEDFYVEVMKSQTSEVFPIWVHGDGGKLKRGSGLFIAREGVSVAHHFMKSEDGEQFKFQEGKYRLNVFAKVAGKKAPKLLYSVELTVGASESAELQDGKSGLYFDWGPRSQSYIAKVDSKSREVDWNNVMSPIFNPPNPSRSQE